VPQLKAINFFICNQEDQNLGSFFSVVKLWLSYQYSKRSPKDDGSDGGYDRRLAIIERIKVLNFV